MAEPTAEPQTTPAVDKEIGFAIEGTFWVPKNLEPVYGASKQIHAYRLPDGRLVRLQVVLEVEDPEKETYMDLSTAEEMDSVGFTCLDYHAGFGK